jgi:hypothetical protein
MTQSIGLSRTELVRVSWKKFRGTNLNHRTRWVPLMVIREEKSIPGPIAPSKLVPRQLTTRLLAYDISSHGHIGPWAARPVDSSPHGQLSPWTALTPRTIRPMDSSRPMDNSPHGQLSFGQLVLWTARPMENSPPGWLLGQKTISQWAPFDSRRLRFFKRLYFSNLSTFWAAVF